MEANFNFFHIKSLTILIGQGNYTSEIFTISNKGNNFTKETKKYFERIIPNDNKSPITIIAKGVNNSGKKMEWGNLMIMVVE